MQLVGAKRWFIVKPFLKEAFWMGLFGGVVASIPIIMVQFTYSYFVYGTNDIAGLLKEKELIVIISSVFILGIALTFFSTWIATWRYLKLRTEELHYY